MQDMASVTFYIAWDNYLLLPNFIREKTKILWNRKNKNVKERYPLSNLNEMQTYWYFEYQPSATNQMYFY